ncbi:MAG: hypothetical protein ACI8P0_000354 [Planctomycetaceae bacterium]
MAAGELSFERRDQSAISVADVAGSWRVAGISLAGKTLSRVTVERDGIVAGIMALSGCCLRVLLFGEATAPGV